MVSTTEHNPKRAFLSYALADRDFARRLLSAMQSASIEVADPFEDSAPGAMVEDVVIESIRGADFVVVITPLSSNDAPWPLMELGAARALGKPIVPVIRRAGWHETSKIVQSVSDRSALDASRLSDRELVEAILAMARPASHAAE